MTDIINFPKDKIVRDPTFPAEELAAIKKKGRKQVADAIINEMTVALFTELENYGIDSSHDDFRKDFIYTMDVMRAMVYRNMSIEHPLHPYIRDSVKVYQRNAEGELVETQTIDDDLDLSNVNIYSKFADDENPVKSEWSDAEE